MRSDPLEAEFDEIEAEIETEEQIHNRRALRKDEFPELTIDGLCRVLDSTIKEDKINKAVAFLCCLSAYTESSQFNISFNAPSSTGKSYIPIEVTSFFPKQDVVKVGYCSPTAFFHDSGIWDAENKRLILDLERKILVFLDQPHNELLHRLRPLLSHDEKEINIKITDKKEKWGLRTKNAVLRGYPAVIFCTAGLQVDEQEATRFMLLSPETTQVKIRLGIEEAIWKESDPDAYFERLKCDPARQRLMRRVETIKEERVLHVVIPDRDIVHSRFFESRNILKPRSQRDVKRLFSLIKAHTLLNLWHRDLTENTRIIEASATDIEAGFRIWDKVSLVQELNIPPYIHQVFQDVMLPLKTENPNGIPRNEIIKAHYATYQRPLSDRTLRREVLPMLEMAGLIVQDGDPENKRRKLVKIVGPDENDQRTIAPAGWGSKEDDSHE